MHKLIIYIVTLCGVWAKSREGRGRLIQALRVQQNVCIKVLNEFYSIHKSLLPGPTLPSPPVSYYPSRKEFKFFYVLILTKYMYVRLCIAIRF